MKPSSQKRIAAKLMKCGVSRVKMEDTKEVEDALTREDIRDLVDKGMIYKEQKKGTSKFATKKKLLQKKKSRRSGYGSRKGTVNARLAAKKKWMKLVRAQRRVLFELRENGQIEGNMYRKLYLRVKGGSFRNKAHLMLFLKENELLKSRKDAMESKETKAKTKVVKTKAVKAKEPVKAKATKSAKKKVAKASKVQDADAKKKE